MPLVIWQRLTLAGFGCYRDRVTFTFQDGLNILVAPNERGKSTLIAGLEAVLFGLPNVSNPEAFGSARFTNRENPDHCEGEVEFLVGGRSCSIKRLFHNNRVTFRVKGDQGWEEIWQGTHNPAALRKIPVYMEHLTAHLGLTSRELFEATFCLGQPLPEGRFLSSEVQRLLSGSGGHYQEALQWLAGDLRSLTRYCGDLGVGNNGRKDARLEELKAEIAALQEQTQATSTALDQLTAVRGRLRELDAEIRKSREELQKQQDLKAAWDGWRALQVRYGSVLREQQQALAARDRARELDARIRRHQEEAARLYPEWTRAPEAAAGQLDRLVELERELNRLQDEIEAWATRLQDYQQEEEGLAARLQGELAAVAGHPDILRDLEDLEALQAEQEKLAGEVKELATRAAAAAAGLADLPDFSSLGRSPATALEGLQLAARQLQEGWEDFQELQRRCRELEAELAGEMGCFTALSPEQEALVANYEASRLAREREEEAARVAVQRIEEQQANYRRRQEEFTRQFGDLEDLGEEALEAAAAKPRLLAGLQAREGELAAVRAARQRRRQGLTLALAGAGVVVALAAGLAGGRWLLALVSFLVLAGAGYVMGLYLGRPGREEGGLESVLAGTRGELERLDARLGLWSGATAAELGELRQRLLAREQARAELAALAASLPGDAAAEAARQALAAAIQARQEFREATAGFSARFADVGAAYRRYQEASRERERLAGEMAAFTTRTVGAEPEAALAVPLAKLSTPWSGLTTLARLAGSEPATVGELLAWLKGFDRDAWTDFLARARRWEEATLLARQVQEKQEQLLQPDHEGRTALDRLGTRIAALQKHITPFTLASDREVIAAQLAEAGKIKARLTELGSLRQAAAGQIGTLEEQREALEPETGRLRQDLAAILAAAGDTAGALQRRQGYERLAREWRGWAEQLAGLLGTGTLEDLAAAYLDAANRAGAILQEWQDLVREHPGLPEPGPATNREELEEHYRALQAGIKELEIRLEALAGEERELMRQQSRLEGQQTVNVALAAETLANRQRELTRMEVEARALALAYRELEAAAGEYSQNYRQELSRRAGQYFILFTGRPERRLEISEDFQVAVREGGAPVALAQLSRGAQDQLYLALRLAIGDLLSATLTLPFIFDDCFVNCDAERRERIKESLLALAPHRQLILLSHDPDFAAWGTPVKIER
ncbi:AAA family ATPase [Moorella naiadis]|uniref:AAA family ATPase n=1 Tax=Moorella naiadis (nom. illeg.) TaxID=3093670 RepID=UPI003D9C9383